MKYKIALRASSLVTVLAAASVGIAADSFHIALTANTEGHYARCHNCRGTKGLGGLARRATAVAQLPEKNEKLLLLDAGNTLFGGESLPSKGEVIVAAYNMLGYDAVNLSYRDMYWGKAATLELARQVDHSPKVVLINWWRTAWSWCQQETPKRVELDKPGGRVARHGGEGPALQQRQCQTCLQRGSIKTPEKC